MIETLIAEGEPLEAQWLYAECGGSLSDLRILEQQDLIILSDADVWRDPLEEIEFVPTEALPLLRIKPKSGVKSNTRSWTAPHRQTLPSPWRDRFRQNRNLPAGCRKGP